MAVPYNLIQLFTWPDFYSQILIALRDHKEFDLFRTIRNENEVFFCVTQFVKYSYETNNQSDKEQFTVLSEILRCMPVQSEVD